MDDARTALFTSLAAVKASGESRLPDDVLRLLDCVSEAVCVDVCERALEAVDIGYVWRLHTTSGRHVYQVTSSYFKDNKARDDGPPHDLRASGVNSDGMYTIFGRRCTCAAYALRRREGESDPVCKHLLAAWIADATGRVNTKVITDDALAKIIIDTLQHIA